MKNFKKNIFLSLLLVGVLAFVGCTQTRMGQETSDVPIKPKVNFRAPDFTLTDLNGNKVKLSDFRGQVVFLNFWASWCPPCKEEMPYIQEIYDERGNNVKVLAINVRESPSKVKQFIKKKDYEFTVLTDENGKVSSNYLIRGIPKTLIINENGIIKAQNTGSMNKTKMNNLIKQAF
ncbi:TlpA family protein disulfide reductase [Sporohalobacter salinus]|uniref:TlpA family protein disulfide reductase n=1 Tax=Sporohalobacter salinus TaxID=1494606 RepID=UPI00196024DE|nr:TlpA disulfide reductase family protein [Sporohalobacter salinus]MBM7623959.1 thiol-disulfide isomerase/thioredoxin [Sporohalobacter salinus]